MIASEANLEFAPPPATGLARAVSLAVLAHVLLMTVIATEVQWTHDSTATIVEAELWSELTVHAATQLPDQARLSPEPVTPLVATKAMADHLPPAGPDPSIAVPDDEVVLQNERQLQQRLLDQKKRQEAALRAKQLREEKETRDTGVDEERGRDPT